MHQQSVIELSALLIQSLMLILRLGELINSSFLLTLCSFDLCLGLMRLCKCKCQTSTFFRRPSPLAQILLVLSKLEDL
jgi:hypothetical protein